MTRRLIAWMTLCAALLASPATAQPVVQTPDEALAQDAAAYAAHFAVPLDEGQRRLRAQLASAATTDRIRTEFSDRLAGISLQHKPYFGIMVLLTGDTPVPDRTIDAGGIQIPVTFRTGARATRAQIVTAIVRSGPAIRAKFPQLRGLGLDQRSGELVVLVSKTLADRIGTDVIAARLRTVTDVPVSIRFADPPVENLSVSGGGRLIGNSPVDGKRSVCTSAFNVSDGTRYAIATAAHCPDEVTYTDADGQKLVLPFGGQSGTRYQDVQINLSALPLEPLFYADRRSQTLRKVSSWRNRPSLRAGDFVCHYGESSGYSCAEIRLTDYAPPMELCGGQCDPMWLTVDGPGCRAGDSGGPVFLGSVALGIFKGGSGTRSARCNFYYFMSTDFLPPGWTLLHDKAEPRQAPRQ
jgi:streptogrisin C